MVEVIRARAKAAAKLKDGIINREIELDEKSGSPGWESPRGFTWSNTDRPIDFDFPRMIRFMGFGFFYAPISVLSVYCGLIVVYLVWVFRFAFACERIWTCFIANAGGSGVYVAYWSCCILHLYECYRGG
jgi:hypothetical protein